MTKIVECSKVDPSSGCNHVVRGATEQEVLQKAAEHAKEHGIRQNDTGIDAESQSKHSRRCIAAPSLNKKGDR